MAWSDNDTKILASVRQAGVLVENSARILGMLTVCVSDDLNKEMLKVVGDMSQIAKNIELARLLLEDKKRTEEKK